MTEADWIACTDPQRMLSLLNRHHAKSLPKDSPFWTIEVSDRKLRLFACACCRACWPLLTDERSRRAVEAAERYADGLISDEEFRIAERAADDVAFAQPHGFTFCPPYAAAWAAASRDESGGPVHCALKASELSGVPLATQANLLRDIVNPFRTYAWTEYHDVSPSGHEYQFLDRRWLNWNSETVPDLAWAIYDDRGFERMPILRDALEDSGCTDETMLSHCFEPVHARGCWLLDLLLGKE